MYRVEPVDESGHDEVGQEVWKQGLQVHIILYLNQCNHKQYRHIMRPHLDFF